MQKVLNLECTGKSPEGLKCAQATPVPRRMGPDLEWGLDMNSAEEKPGSKLDSPTLAQGPLQAHFLFLWIKFYGNTAMLTCWPAKLKIFTQKAC